ncbi:MAG: hypothetical protein ACE5HS_18735, partial [bacterium]
LSGSNFFLLRMNCRSWGSAAEPQMFKGLALLWSKPWCYYQPSLSFAVIDRGELLLLSKMTPKANDLMTL